MGRYFPRHRLDPTEVPPFEVSFLKRVQLRGHIFPPLPSVCLFIFRSFYLSCSFNIVSESDIGPERNSSNFILPKKGLKGFSCVTKERIGQEENDIARLCARDCTGSRTTGISDVFNSYDSHDVNAGK
jgi:hypothetical protein